jgi:hypothetical protein
MASKMMFVSLKLLNLFDQELMKMHRFSFGIINPIATSPSTHQQFSFFSGFGNKDVAFFHPESKTMIQADLLFNLPGYEQVGLPHIRVFLSLT